MRRRVRGHFASQRPFGCGSAALRNVARKWRGPDLIGINSPAATGACTAKGLPYISY